MMLFESYKKNLDWLKKNGIKNVSSDEAETVITYLRSDKEAVVDTADNSVMNKCLKLCEKIRTTGSLYRSRGNPERSRRLPAHVSSARRCACL